MRVISQTELIDATAGSLGLSAAARLPELLKPALRRGAFLLAPCSAADLISFVAQPWGAVEGLRDAVEDALVELIAYGDILEMKRLDSDPWDTPAVALRPAPPSFVLRGKHEAIIIGVSGDAPSPLTADLADQVAVVGPVRVLKSDIEHLDAQLKLLGLSQLSESVWLRMPAKALAKDFLEVWKNRLSERADSVGEVEGLEIIDPAKPSGYYRGRWRGLASGDHGDFVARREQAYGLRLWSFVRVESGRVKKLLDIPKQDDWQRACDVAWRLQSAIDAVRGKPQQFEVRRSDKLVRFGFGGPIPAFAERRLAMIAVKNVGEGALFSFELENTKADGEIAALRDFLWMEPLREGLE